MITSPPLSAYESPDHSEFSLHEYCQLVGIPPEECAALCATLPGPTTAWTLIPERPDQHAPHGRLIVILRRAQSTFHHIVVDSTEQLTTVSYSVHLVTDTDILPIDDALSARQAVATALNTAAAEYWSLPLSTRLAFHWRRLRRTLTRLTHSASPPLSPL